MEISAYDIRAYDIHIYCKLSEIFKNAPGYVCFIAFGSRNKQFCLNAIYKASNPGEIYIDRVQHNDQCVIDGSLKDFKNGTAKIVSTALWFMKSHFKEVTRFTLNDASHIECEKGSTTYKLSLAYDYIIKYNQTWYENKFNAILPGLDPITNKITEDSIYDKYKKSLTVLDEPLYPYDVFKDSAIDLENEEIYKSSSTPREFINNLRKKYDTDYCFKVGKWLNSYMIFLNINIYQSVWYILQEHIVKPEGYIISTLDPAKKSQLFNGGSKNKRKTRKRYNYRLVNADYSEGTIVGYYGDM
jgi:hypothetical protein